MFDRLITTQLPHVAGSALGAVFGAVAKVRRGKPLHPKGAVFDAEIRRTGLPDGWGAEWLETAGVDRGSARLSRSVGLPAPLPDVCGLAVTFTGPHGERHDVLLASTGLAVGTRFLLVPRVDPRACSYGSLFPYAAPHGLVLVSAVPAERPSDRLAFDLFAAGLIGPWRQFAALELFERPGGVTDEPLRLDPMLHSPPGLRWPEPVGAPAGAVLRRRSAHTRGAGQRPGQAPVRGWLRLGRATSRAAATPGARPCGHRGRPRSPGSRLRDSFCDRWPPPLHDVHDPARRQPLDRPPNDGRVHGLRKRLPQ